MKRTEGLFLNSPKIPVPKYYIFNVVAFVLLMKATRVPIGKSIERVT